jgi:Uma2 family endonuclease
MFHFGAKPVSTTTTTPPLSFYGPTPDGFPPLARLSVEKYEAMIASGAFTKHDRFELIEGTLVEKMTNHPPHAVVTGLCAHVLSALLPPGWHTREEKPVRIPGRYSEPEPDVAVVRGKIIDYLNRHPGPEDIALVVEVSDSMLAADRALAATYGGGGIPVYWIVNIRDRQLEVYANPIAGVYPAPTILREIDTVELVIAGQSVGRIPVSDLLP